MFVGRSLPPVPSGREQWKQQRETNNDKPWRRELMECVSTLIGAPAQIDCGG
jgi:hypothetical protein